MADMIVIDAEISEDGKLIVQLPADAPRGQVRVIESQVETASVDDPEVEELLSDPRTFSGLGLTAGEIAQAPEIGMWKDREDMQDPVAYLAEMRRKRHERHLDHD